jgi:hypothetical protein
MDEATKQEFDAVAVLWKGCCNRIVERRTYELWKQFRFDHLRATWTDRRSP